MTMNFRSQLHALIGPGGLNPSRRWYLAALLVMAAGIAAAAWQYPGGYDWVYTVATALASRKKNPAGHLWASAGLFLSMMLLWPSISALRRQLWPESNRAMRLGISALRFAVICFALVGAEGFLLHEFVRRIRKGHEILALAGFLSAYSGVLLLLVLLTVRRRIFLFPVLLVATPLLAVGATQLWLYLEQRHLGWVNPNWREMGIPFWLSFAYWQWLAIALLWAGLGLLAFMESRGRNA